MGKPYQSEIAKLPETIHWALRADIGRLMEYLLLTNGTTLIATGSGGSLSAAKLASFYHQTIGFGFSKSATPLELASLGTVDQGASFLLFSAGGANRDVKMVFKSLAEKEVARFLSLTGRISTPLTKLAQKYPRNTCLEFKMPSGKDGFLATNSLIAFGIFISRAYALASRSESKFPLLLSIIKNQKSWENHISTLKTLSAPLWKRSTLLVLFSPDFEAAAVDLESKFTEAALGTVQIADFRHFAHGRHHWLAKHGGTTSVLAFISEPYEKLASKTLGTLPKSIPVVKLPFLSDRFDSSVTALLTSIILAGFAGMERKIDPGRPGVPAFGRQIYHFGWNPNVPDSFTNKWNLPPIRRKLSAISNSGIDLSQNHSKWLEAETIFCKRLSKQKFKALVLDYDGTTVSTENRFQPIGETIVKLLINILRNGFTIGFASGRGKSIREALQKAIPRSYWNQIIVGYYNGTQIAELSNDSAPITSPISPEFDRLCNLLRENLVTSRNPNIEVRPGQLSITATKGQNVADLWRTIKEVITCNALPMKAVCSAHSIDVIDLTASKRTVIQKVCALARAQQEQVLSIGDKGNFPGNDAELLSTFPSLSVDEVSSSATTCWNLAPVGHFGPSALASYLAAITFGKTGMSLNPKKLKPI